jgi:hypothetical protein
MSTQPSASDYADLLPNLVGGPDTPWHSNPNHPEYLAELVRRTSEVSVEPLAAVGELVNIDYLTLCIVGALRQRVEAQERLLAENVATVVELARVVGEQGKRLDAMERAQAQAQDEFMAGVEPVAYRRDLIHTAPDYPHEREREFKLIVKRQAETVRHECRYPCPVHDLGAFTNEWAQTDEGRALNLRETA